MGERNLEQFQHFDDLFPACRASAKNLIEQLRRRPHLVIACCSPTVLIALQPGQVLMVNTLRSEWI